MYTVDETGVMNAYAVEPDVYLAEYPTRIQQRRYWIQAGLSLFLIVATLCIAFFVS